MPSFLVHIVAGPCKCDRCSRDQRVADNWALLYAVEKAAHTGAPVAVVFNLVKTAVLEHLQILPMTMSVMVIAVIPRTMVKMVTKITMIWRCWCWRRR